MMLQQKATRDLGFKYKVMRLSSRISELRYGGKLPTVTIITISIAVMPPCFPHNNSTPGAHCLNFACFQDLAGYSSQKVSNRPAFPMASGKPVNFSSTQIIPWHCPLHHQFKVGGTDQRNRKADIRNRFPDILHLYTAQDH